MFPYSFSIDFLIRGARNPRAVVLFLGLPSLALIFLYHVRLLRAHVQVQPEPKDVTSSITQRLDQLASVYKEHAVFDAHHLDLGPSVNLFNYTARLDKASRDAFTSTTSGQPLPKLQPVIASARSTVDLHSGLAWTPQDIPQKIITSAPNIFNMPPEFVGWKQLNPDWAIQRFDEKAMDAWVETNLATPTDSGLDKTVVLHIYNQLPRRTLKFDMFRYLMIFLKGGVYADSDTSSVLPIAEWGHKGTTNDMTDFRVLQLAADAQNVTHATSSDSPPTSISKAPPAFIVAIETVTTRDDREGGHLAQYAFASAQGHPIFLDLLQHIVEVSRAMGELVSHFAVLITKSFSSSASGLHFRAQLS